MRYVARLPCGRPDPALEPVCDNSDLLSRTFEAFDLDQSGGIDYEEFVMMVSGRGADSPYEKSDA